MPSSWWGIIIAANIASDIGAAGLWLGAAAVVLAEPAAPVSSSPQPLSAIAGTVVAPMRTSLWVFRIRMGVLAGSIA